MMKIGILALFLFLLLPSHAQKKVLGPAMLDKIENRSPYNPDSCLTVIVNSAVPAGELFPRFLFLKGKCFQYAKAYDSAKFYFSKAEPLLSKDHRRMAYIKYGYGVIAYAENDLKTAKSFYLQAEKWSEATKDNLLNSMVYSELGTICFDLNISDSSLFYYKKALAYAQALGDKAKLATSCNNISIAFYKTGDYEKAIAWQINAIKMKEQIGDTLSLATSLNNVGSLFIKLKKFGDANRYLSRAFRMLNDESKIAGFSALNLGVCFKMTGQYDSAIYYDNKALGIYQKLALESNIGKVYSNLGGVYEAQNNYPKAIEYMLKALGISKKLKNDYETALRSRNVANIYLLLNKPRQAKPFIFEAQKLADDLKSVELSMEVSNTLSKYYEQLGMPVLALKYFKEYKSLNDSLYSQSSQKTISELTARYESEKKEKEILALKSQRRIKDLELKQNENALSRQKLILFFTILTVILILLMLYLGFKRYKLKQLNVQQLMARQKHELEQRMLLSQMNPHFIFNSLSSVQEYIAINEPLQAQVFLTRFASLMRSILENSRQQFIPLDEEIESLKLYMDLEKQRFNNRFDYKVVNRVEEPEFVMVPPMLVQPFVENAIIHGFPHNNSGYELTIGYEQVGDLIQITIGDNGIGRSTSGNRNEHTKKEHVSLGTTVVAERIALLNQELKCKASVLYQDLTNADGNACGTRVLLTLPFKNRED
jgi:tetratricopeptide (TPR) repeat protein